VQEKGTGRENFETWAVVTADIVPAERRLLPRSSMNTQTERLTKRLTFAGGGSVPNSSLVEVMVAIVREAKSVPLVVS